MLELGFAGFLLAHAGVHASFLAPRPPAKEGAPAWPFDSSRSWLLTPLGVGAHALRLLVLALVAVTIGGYALCAIGILGLLPAELATASLVLASTASLGLLAIFFHPWLIIGVLIDAALVFVALTGTLSA